VSGPLEFVRGWNSVSPNPTLVLCDAHIRARNLRCSGTLRWTRLQHETFGGVTHYQALLGTNIPNFEPLRTTLRRTIRHVVDYGIKPAWAPLPMAATLKSTLSLNQRLHPECLTTPILYHSEFSSTGWGSHCLSADEIGIAFGLPAWARLSSLVIPRVFPFVPLQILDGCLKSVLSSTPRGNSLKTPAPPKPVVVTSRSWLRTIQKFLPHSWIDSNLVTDKAVKRDDADAPTHLWDQRCTLVFPHVTPALALLRKILLRLAVTRMYAEFKAYLCATYGPEWQDLAHKAKKQAAQGRFSSSKKRARGDGGGVFLLGILQ
jgi:hypothetical protein